MLRRNTGIVALRAILPAITLGLASASFPQSYSWTALAGPFAGSIRSAVVGSNGVVFASTANGGVFRSTDNGNSWQRVSTWAQDDRVALAVDDSGHVFAGTKRLGLFRSKDNGATWTALTTGLPATLQFNALAADHGGHLFAGTGTDTSGQGLYRSADGGDHWTKITTGTGGNPRILSLAVAPNGYLFAGIGASAGFQPSLVKSSDSGLTWSTIDSGSTVVSIAVSDIGHIFAGSSYQGIKRSTDDGATWVPVGTSFLNSDLIAISAGAGGHVFVGSNGQGLLRSTDDGATWTQIATTFKHSYVWPVLIHPSGFILAGSDWGGVFRSDDAGDNWTQVNFGLLNTPLNRGIVSDGHHLFVGTYDGVFRSDDTGKSWKQTIAGLTLLDVYALALDSAGNLYAGTSKTGLFRSSDLGDTWAKAPIDSSNGKITTLTVDGAGRIFATGVDSVFRSTDNGVHWSKIASGLPVHFSATTLALTRQGSLLLGTAGTGIYRSDDHGDHWTESDAGLAGGNIRSLVVGDSGNIFAASNNGVYRSQDTGRSWISASAGLTDPDIYGLTANSSGHLFAGSYSNGVFRSRNRGQLWTPSSPNLPAVHLISLAAGPDDRLVIGTLGKGIFTAARPHPDVISAPTNLVATPGALQAALKWSQVKDSGIAGYRVYVSVAADPTKASASLGSGSDTSFLVTGLQVDTLYHARVTAVSAGGDESDFSNEVSFRTLVTDGVVANRAAYSFRPLQLGRSVLAFEYDLPEASQTSLVIYNANGNRVATLAAGPLAAGRYRSTWQANAGTAYFFRFETRSEVHPAQGLSSANRIVSFQ